MEKKQSFLSSFVDKFLGPIFWIIAFGVFITLGIGANEPGTDLFAEMGGLQQIAFSILPYVAFTLVARAGGLDFSIYAVAGLSSVVATKVLSGGGEGAIAAFAVAALIGCINGFMSIVMKIPSIISTMLTSSIIAIVAAYTVDQNVTVQITDGGAKVFLGIAIALVIVAFLLNLFTPLGQSMKKRKGMDGGVTVSYFLSYIVASLLAASMGLLMVSSFGAGQAFGQTVDPTLLVVLLIVGSSTLFDNRLVPILLTVVVAFLYRFINTSTMMSWMGEEKSNLFIFTLIFILCPVLLDRVYKFNFMPSFLNRKKHDVENALDELNTKELIVENSVEVKKALAETNEAVDELKKKIEISDKPIPSPQNEVNDIVEKKVEEATSENIDNKN